MSYFLKFTKNNAGWLAMSAQRDTDHAPINVLTEDVGYFPVTAPKEVQLSLPNSNDNYIRVTVTQWRDGVGDPSPRGPWNVSFQIFSIEAPDYHEIPVTPIVNATGKHWLDNGDILFVLNPRVRNHELLEVNTKRYNEWKVSTGR